MTLVEAFHEMRQAGFIQAKDRHSHCFRDIDEWLGEAELDLNDYTPRPQAGDIVQNHSRPCNHFECM